ncbi:hypothetical protein T12_12302 [Trichinella patagoniensis]|uniref:Uncharacterized protein n=1 Tax=Trichinella patagoniensis TaxID=990121 RepID=A0A0V0ZPV9_9BILA|nr:hypothetical protein T12_12302 [Trichinella patagoniensis]
MQWPLTGTAPFADFAKMFAVLYSRIEWTPPPTPDPSRNGVVWTDFEVPAVIDPKDHVENCRVDQHTAYIN